MNAMDIKLKKGISPFVVNEKVMIQWQELVDVAAKLLKVPACLIMRLNEKKIEVFTTSNSKGNPYEQYASEHFFDSGLYCETVIRTDKKLFVPDALKDPHWENNPDVPLKMINYLGFPIKQEDKTPFGTLCILDSVERHYDEEQEHLLIQFRDMIESHLKLITRTSDKKKQDNR